MATIDDADDNSIVWRFVPSNWYVVLSPCIFVLPLKWRYIWLMIY